MEKVTPSAGDNEQYIYCKFIVRNGKKIYPKKTSVFKIPLSKLKKRKKR